MIRDFFGNLIVAASAIMPDFISGTNEACLAAIISHDRAHSKPPPQHIPLIAAITGLFKFGNS